MVKNDFDIDVKVKCLEERVTQAQLAEMVGTSAPYISRLINKKDLIVKHGTAVLKKPDRKTIPVTDCIVRPVPLNGQGISDKDTRGQPEKGVRADAEGAGAVQNERAAPAEPDLAAFHI